MFFLKQQPTAQPTSRSPNLLAVNAMDAGGLAGLAVDILTGGALGCHTMPVATMFVPGAAMGGPGVVTVPTTQIVEQVTRLHVLPGLDAVKVGALGQARAIEALSDVLLQFRTDGELPPLIIDPVMVTSSGLSLAEESSAQVYVKRLMPLATIVTPNAWEAALLTGRPVGDLASLKDAAKCLYDMGVKYPLVKGILVERHAVDLVYDGHGFVEFGADRIPHRAPGSGCAYATAIAGRTALGDEPLEAISWARSWIQGAISDPVRVQQDIRRVHPLYGLYRAAGLQSNSIDLDPKSTA